MNRSGEADPARLGHRLQPRSDVHTIAVEVTVFDDYIAEIQSYTQDDRPVLWQRRVCLLHPILDIDCALNRINGARELGQGAVTHDPNDTAAVFGEQRFENCFAPVSQRGHRTDLVPLHEPAVADHIGRQNGGEAALSAFFGHAEQLFLGDPDSDDCMDDGKSSLSRPGPLWVKIGRSAISLGTSAKRPKADAWAI